jgi:putative ABC transport system permease protein
LKTFREEYVGVIYLAYRNLIQQKMRLALSIGGAALAIMLIVLLNGFLSGVYLQVTAYLDNTPADWVVAQDGVSNLLSATSTLPPGAEDQARGVPGIASVIPIISQFVILNIHDEKVVAYMVGYESEFGGGPWEIGEGRSPQRKDEIVLDRVMAQRHGFSLGDTIELLDEEFKVVGLSEGTNSWMASFIFIEKRAAEDLLLMPDTSSFLLLTMKPRSEPGAVKARLDRRLGDMEVVSADIMKQNDLDLLVEIFAVPLRLMVAISFAVGTAILGMVIYTATVERQREYGVLKAVGAKNRHLYWLVTLQGLATALFGVLIGIGLAQLAASWIMATTPKFLIVLESSEVLKASLIGLMMGLGAAILPAQRVARLDPARVFRK